MILELKTYAKTLSFKRENDLYNELANKFGISAITAKKYYKLSDEDMPDPDKPKKNKLSNKSKNKWLQKYGL